MSRHAGGALLLGWVLMTPPPHPDAPHARVDLTAPRSQWLYFSSFDTAAECEAARRQLANKAKDKKWTVEESQRKSAEFGECIDGGSR